MLPPTLYYEKDFRNPEMVKHFYSERLCVYHLDPLQALDFNLKKNKAEGAFTFPVENDHSTPTFQFLCLSRIRFEPKVLTFH